MIGGITQAEIAAGSVFSILLLITLVILKELASARRGKHWQALGHFLNIALIPLLITFFVSVALRIAAFLR